MENKEQYKTIADIDKGGLHELLDHNLKVIMDNLNDINTDHTKKGKLVATLEFKVTEDRSIVNVDYSVKVTPLPVCKKTTTLLNTQVIDKYGVVKPVLKEIVPGVANGQMDLTGKVHKQMEILYGAGDDKSLGEGEVYNEEEME